jgi:hypothetical protein
MENNDMKNTKPTSKLRAAFALNTVAGLALLPLAAAIHAAPQTHTVSHAFSINDIQGGANNATYATDKTILCGEAGSTVTACPSTDVTGQPIVDKQSNTLYPVESLFGFVVSDFVGAAPRIFDQDYQEGFAGNVPDTGNGTGIAVANVQTDVFKTKPSYGTWCAGLGGVTVKCSSEHYTVMEHVLSCNETVPYTTADPSTDVQRDLIDPDPAANGAVLDNCANNKLSTDLYIVRDFVVSDDLLTDTSLMPANESTVRDDIAVGRDYGITIKDDGKPLYRWGNAVKRPIDLRLYAQMALPQLWKDNPSTAYTVTAATLKVVHSTSNNPNDQIRPEDMENESATGRLPTYTVSGANWVSDRDCYEGDGNFIPAGTLFKNAAFAQGSGAFSSDLSQGLTNAWYTTTGRDPFEAVANVVGPRWRLLANKYGQDIPGLEIASTAKECQVAPPFVDADQKYVVGDVVTTTVDLLDFDGTSPLATSLGWVDASQNSINLGPGDDPTAGNGISVNGLPLTPDFDLALYVKGDKKPVYIYSATLEISWDDVP